METTEPVKKKSFWKTLGKIVAIVLPIAVAASKADVIGGTGGAILKEMGKEEVKENN